MKERSKDSFAVAMAEQKRKKKTTTTNATAKSQNITNLAAKFRNASNIEKNETKSTNNKRPRPEEERKVLTVKRDTNSASNEPKTKRLAIMDGCTKHGFVETPMTPPRNVRFGFLEETRIATPRHNFVTAPATKRKNREYQEPSNVLSKPRWAEKNAIPSPKMKRSRRDDVPPLSSIQVTRLVYGKQKGKNAKRNAALPHELTNFRNGYMYQANVPRITSIDLTLQQAGREALKQFQKRS